MLPVGQRPLQIVRRVVVVMKMDLNFPETLSTKAGDPLNFLVPVHFDRIEKRMAWRSAVSIMKLRKEPRIFAAPSLDPRIGLLA
jgi:hypothetical protein